MCGIFGVVARNVSLPSGLLESATSMLAHRGPDDSGTVILRETAPEPLEIGLGNRRLAILDLSPLGHQPMQDRETGNWIAYNGEIYNFHEIRERLERKGMRFCSHSDTEVLLKAYACWGERCLEELRGMFAFGIWDAQRHRLFLARDPMGIKPMYYCASGEYFLFASEIRTLLGTGLVPRRLDPIGLINYLSFGSLCDPGTMIEGISALRAGHYLTWQTEDVQETCYWDLVDPTSADSHPTGEIDARQNFQEEVTSLLDEAVRMQMASDVPVGVFLSGGIDSSALVGILARNGIRPKTFSIVFREADYSEAEYSRAVAHAFGTEHQEILVSQHDALEAIPPALHAMDQPTIDGINTYLISRQTRAAGIKVALSGLGGDEVFAGYATFRSVPRMERFARVWGRVPSALRGPLAAGFAMFLSETDQGRKLTELVRDGNLLHPYFLSRMLFTYKQVEALMMAIEEERIGLANRSLRESLHRTRTLDPVNRVSYLESRCYMLNTLLRDSDVMSMAHGLELRVPLIDHRLAKRLLAVPGAWKLDDNTPKPLLVGALSGALPDRIVHRRKRGFTLPFEHWLRGELQAEVEQSLRRVADGPLASVLRPEVVMQVWGDFQQRRTSWSRVWSLYVLQRWCEENAVRA